jgi:hypothetical protein
VLTSQEREKNSEWIQKANTLSRRQLEREIAQVRPQEATPERASYINSERIKLELGLSEREMLKLRRVQDILSQAKRRPVNLEETLAALTDEFLKRHDPIEKAKRHQVRKGPTTPAHKNLYNPTKKTNPVRKLVPGRVTPQREPIPTAILHRVNLRDQRRCAYKLPNGKPCAQSRWIEIHHKMPVSQGGANSLENLITLCSAHHKLMHLNE